MPDWGRAVGICMAGLLSASPALAGDLWMTITDSDPADGTVRLELPANWLVEETNTIQVNVGDQQLDLVKAAQAIKEGKEGTRRSYPVTQDDGTVLDVVLEHRKRRKGQSKTLAFQLGDGEGAGMGFTLALDSGASQFSLVGDKLDGHLDIDGLDLDFGEEDLLAQLRDAPPVVLLEAKGDEGGVLRIETR